VESRFTIYIEDALVYAVNKLLAPVETHFVQLQKVHLYINLFSPVFYFITAR